jgi:Branched-chain amino acid transport system / permease component
VHRPRRAYSGEKGRVIDSVREGERLAQYAGVPIPQVKVAAFVLATALVGIQGGLTAHYLQYIDPSSFTSVQSLAFVVMNVIGGMRSLALRCDGGDAGCVNCHLAAASMPIFIISLSPFCGLIVLHRDYDDALSVLLDQHRLCAPGSIIMPKASLPSRVGKSLLFHKHTVSGSERSDKSCRDRLVEPPNSGRDQLGLDDSRNGLEQGQRLLGLPAVRVIMRLDAACDVRDHELVGKRLTHGADPFPAGGSGDLRPAAPPARLSNMIGVGWANVGQLIALDCFRANRRKIRNASCPDPLGCLPGEYSPRCLSTRSMGQALACMDDDRRGR